PWRPSTVPFRHSPEPTAPAYGNRGPRRSIRGSGSERGAMIEFDLAHDSVRALNVRLHHLPADTNERSWRVLNPRGAQAIAPGLPGPVEIIVEGHVGYYCGGMNKEAAITINGHAGTGVGENMMSGWVRVAGNASQSAGASGRGGMLIIKGDASARCG